MKALTRHEKISLSTTEIAKRIRTQLKEEFKACKFSVTRQYYSMGSSVTVRLMKADRRIKKNFEELTTYALHFYKENHYTEEQLKALLSESYHQLNEYILRDKYKPDFWCNGVFLTEEGHKFLRRVVEIADFYNFNDSDSQTDYYHVNFSFHLSLGKWDKPFIDGADSEDHPKTDWSNVLIEI